MDVSLTPKSMKSAQLPPTESMETEGQRQLKRLLDKQLQKDVSITQQLSQKRNFTSGVCHDPSVNRASGLLPLEDFQNMEDLDTYSEELIQCGLTAEEIKIKLSQDHPHLIHDKLGRYGIDPNVKEQQLKDIDTKIKRKKLSLKKSDSFHGQQVLSRHEMEVENSLLRDSGNATCQLTAVLTKVGHQQRESNPDDPMNQLEEILAEVSGQNCKTQSEKQKGGKKRIKSALPVIQSQAQEDHTVQSQTESRGSLCIEKEEGLKDGTLSSSGVSDNAIQQEICYPIQSIPKCDIESNRMNEEQIKELPRFGNYSPGMPSNVLYLKNLSKKVTSEDLVSLFGRFQEPHGHKIVYRLMTGKMKGQAFVEFEDLKTASKALQLVNGYLFKEKHIIIQYGKKSKSQSDTSNLATDQKT